MTGVREFRFVLKMVELKLVSLIHMFDLRSTFVMDLDWSVSLQNPVQNLVDRCEFYVFLRKDDYHQSYNPFIHIADCHNKSNSSISFSYLDDVLEIENRTGPAAISKLKIKGRGSKWLIIFHSNFVVAQ